MNAPAKLNLCLYLGPRREDGLHELCSIFQPLALADRIVLSDAERDEVVCEDIEGPNLAATALARLRQAGWSRPPLRAEIEKRIPVAAGLGGGSADAGAVLRLAAGEIAELERIAGEIGADVPSQLEPRLCLVGGAGERIETLPDPGEYACVLIPDRQGLATGDVFAEADRLGLGRESAELAERRERLLAVAGRGASPLEYTELLVNDLEPAAISLRPGIADGLRALREAGAEHVLMTGSGPTTVGLFADIAKADAGAGALPPRYAGAIVTGPERWV